VDFDPVHVKLTCKSDEELEVAARELGISKEVLELFPNEFEESELGMIPKGWRIAPIGNVTTVSIGKTPPRKEQKWFSEDEQDIKWVSIKDMGDSGIYIQNTSEYLTREAIGKFNVKVIPSDTVILSFKMTVGRVSITTEDMCTNEAIAHFELESNNNLTPEYLYCHLKNFDFRLLGSTSSIATAVNSKIVRTIPTILPTDNVMKSFNKSVKGIFDKIKNTTSETQTLQKTRDTLLPKLLSGELDVSEIAL
jgi:type I restriction enzyme S subunit